MLTEQFNRHKPPELPSSFFGWIIPLIKVDEQELLQTVGLDAVVVSSVFPRWSRQRRIVS